MLNSIKIFIDENQTKTKIKIIEETKIILSDEFTCLRCQTIFFNADMSYIDIYVYIKNNNIWISDQGQSCMLIYNFGSEFLESQIENIKCLSNLYGVNSEGSELKIKIGKDLYGSVKLFDAILQLIQCCIRVSSLQNEYKFCNHHRKK